MADEGDVLIKQEQQEDGDEDEEEEVKHRFECKFKDQFLFKTLVNCAQSIQDKKNDSDVQKLTLKVTKKRLSYIGIDANHVSLVQWSLEADKAFDLYDVETTNKPAEGEESGEFTFSVDLQLINKVLKICKTRDIIYLLYDTEVDRETLSIALLDPRGERIQEGIDAANEANGAAGAPKSKKKQEASSGFKLNEFKIRILPVGNESALEIPPKKDDATRLQMPVASFRYVQDTLHELANPDQKKSKVYVQCPTEDFTDMKDGTSKPVDMIRFGSENATGGMSVDFIVAGTLEQQLEIPNQDQVFLNRKEGFDSKEKCRFRNESIIMVGSGLPVAETVLIFLSREYPLIFTLPLQHECGELNFVVSPTLENSDDADEGVPGDGDAADEDIFAEEPAEEDEFSDG
ncbi:unnamed protein product [Amoebophrya sp. A120]|nr:unnamed protein product [Amoebophrya sp. A120]|eukprot:GSA120T00002313001.1